MTNHLDVLNGDADGILALLQLRLANPCPDAILITGIKRDIGLLNAVDVKQVTDASKVTVLDISMAENNKPLMRILEAGAKVLYIDHHQPGTPVTSLRLETHIDLSADTCTSLIVDSLLNGQFHLWAMTAAFGDNLVDVASDLSEKAGLSGIESQQLKELGTLINYNGYGAHVDELTFHPADLFRLLLNYTSPFDCINDKNSPYHVLKTRFEDDLKKAQAGTIIHESDTLFVILLPNEAHSRRISGTYGNTLANDFQSRAHIVLTLVDAEHYLVSLRAPVNNKTGAGDICAQFNSGGGRAGAGGINKLPKSDLERLIKAAEKAYSSLN